MKDDRTMQIAEHVKRAHNANSMQRDSNPDLMRTLLQLLTRQASLDCCYRPVRARHRETRQLFSHFEYTTYTRLLFVGRQK
jgi:hypothetical protein